MSISAVLNLNNIIGCVISVPGDKNERSNWALNMVDFAIFSSLANIESCHLAPRGVFTTQPIWSSVGCFVVILLSLFSYFECGLFDWIWINFLEDLFSKYSHLCVLWRYGSYCICLWFVYLRCILWLVLLLLNFFPMIIIHALFLFPVGKFWFHCLLLFDLDT